MFTADGIFIVSLIVVAYLGMKWHLHVKLNEIIKQGGFAHKGKQYDIYYLGRADNPKAGIPEVLLNPDNGAFAPDTLSKVKFLNECDRQMLSTMKDDLALCHKCAPSPSKELGELDKRLFESK